MPTDPLRTPILITGSHRSGTTWVGRILSAAPGTVYVSEPFNPLHRPGICRAEFPLWYTHVHAGNEHQFSAAIDDMLAFRYGIRSELGALRSLKDGGRMLRDASAFLRARLARHSRAIIKDPIALLSTQWLVSRYNAHAVVLVRHPAAFAASLKRVGWKLSFSNFLEQPALMDGCLQRYSKEIEQAVKFPPGVVERGALLWKILYAFVLEELVALQQVRVIRHEDLSLNPAAEFLEIFRWTGLSATSRVTRIIETYSNTDNPKEARGKKVFELKRNSAASIHTWRYKLSREEIESVYRIASPLLDHFYPEESALDPAIHGEEE